MGEFRMPSLGADMDTGTVTRWLVKPGDTVHRGDVVAEVDTDKATIEVEVFEDGVVDTIVVPEGEQVPVGTVLATLRAVAAPASEPTVAAPAGTVPVGVATAPLQVVASAAVTNGAAARGAPSAPPLTAVEPAVIAPPPPQGASPLARRLGAVLGVDLGTVQGTGPGGVVTRADVQHAATAAVPATAVPTPAAPVPAPPPAAPVEPPPPAAPAAPVAVPAAAARADTTVEDRQAAMRRAIAALMARSKAEIPHYYLGTHIDMARAVRWLEETNLDRPVAGRLVAPVLLLKAVALAAREFPDMNGFVVDGIFRPAGGVHLGVAVSLRGGGLVAPCIHDADEKSLDELMGDLHGLVERARTGRLRSSEMSDPTLTVTNLGDQGVETVYGIIYWPQVALVGFGRIVERPWASEGMVGARPVVHATLSADHRVSDGHRGARFLAAVDRHLQEPEKL